MRDEGNLIAENETATSAGDAVLYLLRRMRVDANLRYYLLHTEAFALLCAAESERTGDTLEEVETLYSSLREHCLGDRADVVKLEGKVEKFRLLSEDRKNLYIDPGVLLEKMGRILEER